MLLLILSVILKSSSTKVDYTAAFCKAPIANDVYMYLPKRGQQLNKMGLPTSFKENYIIKLNRSLYGIRDSPRNFFKHLEGKLEQCEFVQSPQDPYLFIGPKVIFVVYVDDCLLLFPFTV